MTDNEKGQTEDMDHWMWTLLAYARRDIQVKRELEAAQVEAIIDKKSVTSTAMESISVCNVRFRCPLTGDIIQKEEREEHIRKAIQMLAITNPTSASIMKIHTFNKDRERVKNGTETISKYFDNIISNPDEEKYRKIKLSNKVFQERINSLEGANEFLEAVGFEKKMLPVPGQEVQEEFYMLSNIATETLDTLQKQRDVLLSAEPLKATLERQPRVFTPSIQAAHFNLPDDFYNLTADEIKREQRLRTEALDRSSMLRTKAMREKEEQREMRKYNYTVMRVRLPDGYILQGMFYAREKVSALSDFVRDQLQTDWLPFELLAPGGHKLEDEHVAFNECGLVPSALLTFRWDAAVLADVEAAGGQEIKSVLKPELLAKAETLS
ncbi:UBX domain-containing protein 6 isoform X2 [Bombina bombina]|uniref:UBX domain-containing protein 6 isoform X2 n=1 Tax=Bombina bombina TaxID=8345 RepID=UPI00235AEB0D|nr:UBX domain-containing protein 6 isoform X2 [Bombina bombina]